MSTGMKITTHEYEVIMSDGSCKHILASNKKMAYLAARDYCAQTVDVKYIKFLRRHVATVTTKEDRNVRSK